MKTFVSKFHAYLMFLLSKLKYLPNSTIFLLPGLLRVVAAFAILPLSTMVLTAEDYGIFAFALVFSGAISSISTAGVSFIFSANHKLVMENEGMPIISSALWVGIFTSGILSILFYFSAPILFASIMMEPGNTLAPGVIELTAIMPVLTIAPTIQYLLALAKNRPIGFAFSAATDVLIGNFVLLLAIFYFGLEGMSLFIGACFGVGSSTIVAFFAQRESFLSAPKKTIMIDTIKRLLIAFPQIAFEQLRLFTERALLARYAGVAFLGLYAHSLTYKNSAQIIVKAYGSPLWSAALNECRSDPKKLNRTNAAWDRIYLPVTLVGIGMAFFGDEFISLLTNDVFTKAYHLASLWMVYVLLDNYGRDAVAKAYFLDKQAWYQSLILAINFIGILCMLILTPFVGASGVIIGMFMVVLLSRGVPLFVLIKQGHLEFHPSLVPFGVTLILVSLAFNQLFTLSLLGQTVACSCILFVTLCVFRKQFSEWVNIFQGVMKSGS